MATRDTYEVQQWENLPSDTTPVSAERLAHIEQGIKDASDKRALKEIYDDRAMSLGRKEGTYPGNNSATAGYDVSANGNNCFAGGQRTKASGNNSFVSGNGTIASGAEQHVTGRFNVEDYGTYANIVGGGSNEADRKNIHTLDWAGNGYFAGDVSNGAGVTLNGLKESLDNLQVEYMTYEETTTALNSQETGEINKIPNIYAIRDWCKQLLNQDSGI